MNRRLAVPATAAFLLTSACTGSNEDRSHNTTSDNSIEPETETIDLFVEVAHDTGLDFVYFNGMSGEFYFNEMMGGGAALFDYDNDGDLDVYLVQGHMLGRGKTVGDAQFAPHHPQPLTDRLFRNDLVTTGPNSGTLRFTDVTDEVGELPKGYGMGVAAADYDNDGWVDLYVTNFKGNNLLRNRGDGTFEDATVRAGTDDRRWSVTATFLDYDRDGWLDLYVGNYVDFSLASHALCPFASGVDTYCGPAAYRSEPDSLFRNRGDGTFENVTAIAGLDAETGSGLGAVAADLNSDGWIDLYVGNDSLPNFLWINQRDGTFSNEALFAGVALNQDGQPEASMGIDAGDFDADGDLDLFLTHLKDETNTLYLNDGKGLFEDISTRSGVGLPSLVFTGFGTGWLDYDNDGWLDLLVANGSVVGLENLIRAEDPYPLHQTNQLFRNLGDGSLVETTSQAGQAFQLSEVSRSAALGDIDNDGDTDAVVVNNNGPTRLLLNQLADPGTWVGLRVVDRGRDALGAETSISSSTGRTLKRRVHTDGSYASANDPRVLVAIPDALEPLIEVRWPDGEFETWTDLELNRYSTIRRGSGQSP